MGLLDRFRRSETSSQDQVSAADLGIENNDAVLKKQRMLLYSGTGVALVAAGWWIFSAGNSSAPSAEPGSSGQDIRMSADDLGTRNLSEKEWIALSENRLQAQDSQLQRLQGQGDQMAQMQAQLDALRAQNASMEADGKSVLAAYESENNTLKQQLNAAQTQPAGGRAGPRSLYGAEGPAAYQSLPSSGDGVVRRPGELKVITFGTPASASSGAPQTPSGGANRTGGVSSTDSPNYLPANSFATARVIVGVDASSNVQSQSDPLPVVLRITGPARSVANGSKVLKTRLEGCLVNGAARGDLSSEKVYVKLARMTCPQPGGRYAESEVKGFIAFGGKTGVRGRVVSREGNLAMSAFLAGVVGGVGRGFSVNTQSVLSGSTTVVNGQRQKLSAGEIAQAGFGEGVSSTGDRVSQYLIERAEQYQPVIEMPTGIDVEIVFLEGTFIRN